MSKKYVFDFTEGGVGDIALLGIKGGNLAAMTQMGLAVPVGFTITTDGCKKFLSDKETFSNDFFEQIWRAIRRIEKEVSLNYGDGDKPLLFSMRTGASVTMKGLARTVLNIGMNDEIVSKILRATKNPVFAWEIYCRFIRDYSTIVAGLDAAEFREAENKIRIDNAGTPEPEMLQKIISQFKKIYKKYTKNAFPQDVKEQIIEAIKAGLRSVESRQAQAYRRINNIPDDLGCAVSVQAMVYGNYDMESGVGVAHTRNTITGANEITGEFVRRSQDKNLLKSKVTYDMAEIKKAYPSIFIELSNTCHKLENFFQDVMTIEFCIQSNKLYIMQVERAERTPQASVKAAVEMAESRIFSRKKALNSIEASGLKTLMQPVFEPERLEYARVLGEGLCAYPGCASGVIALSAAMALEYAIEGKSVILVRESTNPHDAEGIAVASGLITTTGGTNCHAGVVSRAIALPCITSCKRLSININTHAVKLGGMNYHEGDIISIDAGRGVVYGEALPLREPSLTGDLGTVIDWAKPSVTIPIYADADTPSKVKRALSLGASGIGIVRTENMFFKTDKINAIRRFLLATDKKARDSALKSMLKSQTTDFIELFGEIGDREVNIRLMDPQFHKFIPASQNALRAIARDLDISFDEIKESIDNLTQTNPVIGIRGARLLIMYPELIDMQVTAVINALVEVKRRKKTAPNISFLVPMVSIVPEFEAVAYEIRRTIDGLKDKIKFDFSCKIGCMLETPRACLIADKLANIADYVAFGINDLTQLTFGYSRDDCTKFLKEYYSDNLIYSDPFASLDKVGVYELMDIATQRVRRVNPKMPIWLLGEQTSDPETLRLAIKLKINRISCSPNKIPSAILSQAQCKESEK